MDEGLAYNRQERRERQVLGLEDFTEADIAALQPIFSDGSRRFLRPRRKQGRTSLLLMRRASQC